MSNIYTVHEVRRNLEEVYNNIETLNAHILSNGNTLDNHDVDMIRRSWEQMRKIISSRWTNQIL